MQVKDMNFGHLGAAINGVTNVETLVVTSNAVIMPNPTAHVLIHGYVNVSQGVGGGTGTIKLYRGNSLAGNLLATWNTVLATGSQVYMLPFDWEEDLAFSAGAQYTASFTFSTNQAANNINNAEITVTVL